MLQQILTECHQQNVGPIIIITRGVWGGHILDQFVQSTNTKPNIPGVMAYNWNSQFYIWMDWKWVNISCDMSHNVMEIDILDPFELRFGCIMQFMYLHYLHKCLNKTSEHGTAASLVMYCHHTNLEQYLWLMN